MNAPQPVVAFQGELGAFSEQAALVYFGPRVRALPCRTFREVFAVASSGRAGYGIVPIENSLTGSIHATYDLLLSSTLCIVGEVEIRVSHQLVALPGVRLSVVRRVLSHPQALAQCEESLGRLLPQAELVPTYDTAGSAKLLAEQGINDGAAVVSRRAAQLHNLEILAQSIEDDPENYSRFLALASSPAELSGETKTSIVFSMSNAPGALYRCLAPFARRRIDLTKIESRPMRGKRWEYLFYVDFVADTRRARCREALEELRENTVFLKFLGSYRSRGQFTDDHIVAP